MKCCLSVRLSAFFWHGRSSVVSARINARFTRHEAPILGEHGDFLKMVLSPVVRRLRRFECQDVDNSCRNFTYIPAKPQPRHNSLHIPHFLQELLNVQSAVMVVHLAYCSKGTDLIPQQS